LTTEPHEVLTPSGPRSCVRRHGSRALIVGELERDRLRALIVLEFVAEEIVEHDHLRRITRVGTLTPASVSAARRDVPVGKLHERAEQPGFVAVDQDVELERLLALTRGRQRQPIM
jgi:hypothetical protein